MQATALTAVGAFASRSRLSEIEIEIEFVLVAVATVILVLLLAVRSKRSRAQRIRRAASEGYYDSDAARYAPGSAGSSLVEKSVTTSPAPMAPSFVSPERAGHHRGDRHRPPLPIAPAFAADDRPSPTPVRPFDAVEAQQLRQARTAVPSAPPETSEATGDPARPDMGPPADLRSQVSALPAFEAPPAPTPVEERTSALPPLVQPPPPAKTTRAEAPSR